MSETENDILDRACENIFHPAMATRQHSDEAWRKRVEQLEAEIERLRSHQGIPVPSATAKELPPGDPINGPLAAKLGDASPDPTRIERMILDLRVISRRMRMVEQEIRAQFGTCSDPYGQFLATAHEMNELVDLIPGANLGCLEDINRK